MSSIRYTSNKYFTYGVLGTKTVLNNIVTLDPYSILLLTASYFLARILSIIYVAEDNDINLPLCLCRYHNHVLTKHTVLPTIVPFYCA